MIKTLSAAEFENAGSRPRAEHVEVWKTRKFIEEHSGEELSLRRVAKAVNIHPNYLSEKFKQVTGMNFVEYVARTRFEKACRLLHDGDLRISDIAFAAGFQSLDREIANAIPYCQACESPAPVGFRQVSKKKPEKMRSQHFAFLRILAIRVALETHSMDPR